VSPVKYELGFYIPEDDVLHSHRRGNLKSYTKILSPGPVPDMHSVLPVIYKPDNLTLGLYPR
jgi:hypothetical protein